MTKSFFFVAFRSLSWILASFGINIKMPFILRIVGLTPPTTVPGSTFTFFGCRLSVAERKPNKKRKSRTNSNFHVSHTDRLTAHIVYDHNLVSSRRPCDTTFHFQIHHSFSGDCRYHINFYIFFFSLVLASQLFPFFISFGKRLTFSLACVRDF